jgi:hypothetical protein
MKVGQGSLHMLQVVCDVGAAVEVLVQRRPQDFLRTTCKQQTLSEASPIS